MGPFSKKPVGGREIHVLSWQHKFRRGNITSFPLSKELTKRAVRWSKTSTGASSSVTWNDMSRSNLMVVGFPCGLGMVSSHHDAGRHHVSEIAINAVRRRQITIIKWSTIQPRALWLKFGFTSVRLYPLHWPTSSVIRLTLSLKWR